MKNTYQVAAVIAATILAAALLLAPTPGLSQAATPTTASDQAVRARRLAEQFERNARVLTLFDRQGKVVATVGERGIYVTPVFSPDRTRLAVIKDDLESETVDLWVLDVATGNSTRITSNQRRQQELVQTPVWSPDGGQLAYVALRGGYRGLYRKASNGEGTEELLYQYPGGNMTLTDWSLDGRFLSFSSVGDLSGGTLYVLPLADVGERKPIVVSHSESALGETRTLGGARLSPDSRFLSYQSNQSGRNETWVRPFDPSAGTGATAAAGPWQVSDQGSGGAVWRRDGKELYYVARDRGLMVVEVSTAPTFTFGKPKLLYRPPEGIPNGMPSRDGERAVALVNPVPTVGQITVFDRQGEVLSKVGEPGVYWDPAPSPDGTKVAVEAQEVGAVQQIWMFDVATGKGELLTGNDTFGKRNPFWSPDGRQLAYVSIRGPVQSIVRRSADGKGDTEQLFEYTPGVGLHLTSWSADGKFMTFNDGNEGVLYVLPLGGDQRALKREAMEWLRDEYQVADAQLSPDSRHMAYLSNEGKSKEEINSSIFEVYVRPFDPAKSDVSSSGERPVQVSTAGALGMVFWRKDGKEMYYLTPDWEVMAVDVTTTPRFRAGAPKLLFKLPARARFNPVQWQNITPDGQRFVFVIEVPAPVAAR